jgi:mRNA interferase RelE/StbE
MRVSFLRRFSKDLDNIVSIKDRLSILAAIEKAKKVQRIEEIPGIKKLIGFKNEYRIRSGDFRIGLFLEGDRIEFARVVHRKNIYKVFP